MPKAAQGKTKAKVPQQRTPAPEPVLTDEQVWKAMPPLGQPALTTTELAQHLGVHTNTVFHYAQRLAADGRAQQLYRDGRLGYWWRRR